MTSTLTLRSTPRGALRLAPLALCCVLNLLAVTACGIDNEGSSRCDEAQRCEAPQGDLNPSDEAPDQGQYASSDQSPSQQDWDALADGGAGQGDASATFGDAPARLTASRTQARFARARPGFEQSRQILITFEGEAPRALDIESGQIAALQAHGVELSWVDLHTGEARSVEEPLAISPHQSVALELRHVSAAQLDEGASETLSIGVLDVPEAEPMQIAVQTGAPGPCLHLDLPFERAQRTMRLRAEEAAPGQSDIMGSFEAINCGLEDEVTLEEIYISRDPHGVLALSGERRGVGEPVVIKPGASYGVELEIDPLMGAPGHASLGQVTLISDALDQQRATVEVLDELHEQGCAGAPVVIESSAGQRIEATGDLLFIVEPLKELSLTAQSIEPASPTRPKPLYLWSLVAKPSTSLARLREPLVAMTSGLPGENEADQSAQKRLFLDVPGEYIVELEETTGTYGERECGPTRLSIRATPSQDIYISTTWETPLDLDIEDHIGADLDVHYLHPQGSFEHEVYDIFWRNRTADWGEPGPQDDPELLRDDRDGSGPEVVAHRQPVEGLTYRVGVHAFDPMGLGASQVSTTVHIHGLLAATSSAQPLFGAGSYLEVATITWSASPSVTLIEEITALP